MRNSDTFSITLMCKVLRVSRASFYHYFYYSTTNDNKNHLYSRILSIYFDSKSTYGAPRITAALNKEGIIISAKTVAKHMRALGIMSIVKAKFPKRKNRITDEEKAKIINLTKNIIISRPNQVWTTDITYIKTKDDGFVYLSTIIDLYSRKVIAWKLGYNMKKELVINTLIHALKNRKFPKGVIIHSDKGSQYRSHDFRALVVKNKCLYSYTSIGHSCDENANQESFHATIKKEWLHHQTFYHYTCVKRACFRYIEGFYNNHRIHSSLGYVTPAQFEFDFYFNIPLLPLSHPLT